MFRRLFPHPAQAHMDILTIRRVLQVLWWTLTLGARTQTGPTGASHPTSSHPPSHPASTSSGSSPGNASGNRGSGNTTSGKGKGSNQSTQSTQSTQSRVNKTTETNEMKEDNHMPTFDDDNHPNIVSPAQGMTSPDLFPATMQGMETRNHVPIRPRVSALIRQHKINHPCKPLHQVLPLRILLWHKPSRIKHNQEVSTLQHGKSFLLFWLLAVGVIGALIFYFWQRSKKKKTLETEIQTRNETTKATKASTTRNNPRGNGPGSTSSTTGSPGGPSTGGTSTLTSPLLTSAIYTQKRQKQQNNRNKALQGDCDTTMASSQVQNKKHSIDFA